MIDSAMSQLALRARLSALSVATTGLVALAATSTGYSRMTGSFLADGFWRDMEVTPVGFADTTRRIVTAVSALTLTVSGAVPVEASAPGRALTVGLPQTRLWENVTLRDAAGNTTAPAAGRPYVEEQYADGTVRQIPIGPNAMLVCRPMYHVYVHVPADTGMLAARYATAVLRLFPPRDMIPLANGDVLRVRTDVAPSASQLQQSAPGFAVKVVTIPLHLPTPNSI